MPLQRVINADARFGFDYLFSKFQFIYQTKFFKFVVCVIIILLITRMRTCPCILVSNMLLST